jgi:hypothetical protein
MPPLQHHAKGSKRYGLWLACVTVLAAIGFAGYSRRHPTVSVKTIQATAPPDSRTAVTRLSYASLRSVQATNPNPAPKDLLIPSLNVVFGTPTHASVTIQQRVSGDNKVQID